MTPAAASRPKALPPVSRTPWTCPTSRPGRMASVSRVPGANPRTSTPAVAPALQSTTVQPVHARGLVAWPTRMPLTAVMVVFLMASALLRRSGPLARFLPAYPIACSHERRKLPCASPASACRHLPGPRGRGEAGIRHTRSPAHQRQGAAPPDRGRVRAPVLRRRTYVARDPGGVPGGLQGRISPGVAGTALRAAGRSVLPGGRQLRASLPESGPFVPRVSGQAGISRGCQLRRESRLAQGRAGAIVRASQRTRVARPAGFRAEDTRNRRAAHRPAARGTRLRMGLQGTGGGGAARALHHPGNRAQRDAEPLCPDPQALRHAAGGSPGGQRSSFPVSRSLHGGELFRGRTGAPLGAHHRVPGALHPAVVRERDTHGPRALLLLVRRARAGFRGRIHRTVHRRASNP